MNRAAPFRAEYRASVLAVWIALSAVYLIWGSTYLAIRFTVESLPPFLSAAARFIVSGAVLYFWRRAAGDPAPTAEERRNAAVIGTFLLVGGNGGVVWAAQFIPSSLSALLVATVPLWMICFDVLRHGEKPRPTALGGILIGFCGALLLVGWTGEQTTAAHLHGAAAVLGASCLWAIGSIYGKTAKLPRSPLVTTGVEMLAGGTLQIFVAYFVGEFERFHCNTVSQRSLLAWVYLTVVGPAAFVAYAWLLRVAPIPLVATYSYVNPLVAIVLGYFLGKERITARIIIAAALIIGSVALVGAPKRKRCGD